MNRAVYIIALTGLAGMSLAQAASPLRLVLSQSLVQTLTENGKSVEKLLPEPKSVLPGAVLEEALMATNLRDAPLGNVVINLPVPKGTSYLAALSTPSAQTLYSADQGRTFGPAPLMKTITVTENGKSVQKRVEVKPNEYTTVRWIIPQLGALGTLKLGFRVTVKE